MSSKNQIKRKNSTTPHQTKWLWLILAGALVLVGGGLSLVWMSSGQNQPVTPPEVSGAPRLAVDQTMVDEGDVKLDIPVQTSFRLRNIGNQTLRILDEPQVELREGC